MGKPYLSVVVPAWNEAHRLDTTLPRILSYFREAGLDAEILIVDDGSTDRTAELARERLRGHRGRVLSSPENRGKGYSVRQGIAHAAARWVLMTDADLSTPIEEHAKLAAAARDRDLDVVIGTRAHPGSRIEVRQSRLRESLGKTFNLLMRPMTGLPFRDTQCGFKLMDRERIRPLVERMVVDRFAFDVELLFLCARYGIRVGEVPVVWRNEVQSKVSMVTDPVNMLWDVLKIRWRYRRGAYDPEQQPSRAADGSG